MRPPPEVHVSGAWSLFRQREFVPATSLGFSVKERGRCLRYGAILRDDVSDRPKGPWQSLAAGDLLQGRFPWAGGKTPGVAVFDPTALGVYPSALGRRPPWAACPGRRFLAIAHQSFGTVLPTRASLPSPSTLCGDLAHPVQQNRGFLECGVLG
jgi:hypothetical protein